MTLPRTVADVLARHVRFEVECIDRMYLRRCLRTPAGERCVTFRGVRWGCTRRITAR